MRGYWHPEVRLIMRGSYNWTDRYPSIVEAARKNRVKQFVIKGEAVVHRRRRRRRFQSTALPAP
jgi:bifunctional non-homologous end joining protein LigD